MKTANVSNTGRQCAGCGNWYGFNERHDCAADEWEPPPCDVEPAADDPLPDDWDGEYIRGRKLYLAEELLLRHGMVWPDSQDEVIDRIILFVERFYAKWEARKP